MIGIYRIVNKLNGKCYVGQSMHLEDRMHSHLSRSSSDSLRADIRALGDENFYEEILEECSVEELNTKEIEYVALYKANDPSYGYNIRPGGGHQPGYVTKDSTKKLLSEKRLQLTHSVGFINPTSGSVIIHKGDIQSRVSKDKLDYKLSNGWELGASDKFKQNLSNINSGENNPAYRKGYEFSGEKNHFYGKHHTEESKQKIRDHMPDTTFNWRGKHHTEESKAKMKGPRPSVAGENNHAYGKRGKASYLYGYKAIHKDGVGKRVKPEDLQKYLDEGWTLGNRPNLMTDEKRKMYANASNRGCKMMNNGQIAKYIQPSEFDEYLSNGWIFGKVSSQRSK